VVYINDVKNSWKGAWSQGHGTYVQFNEPTVSENGTGHKEYKVTGRRNELKEPKLRFRVHHMDLTSDDKERMKLNPKHLPNPNVGDRRSGEFHLPLGLRVVWVQSREIACLCVNRMPVSAFKSSSRMKNSSSFSLIETSTPFILSISPQWMLSYSGAKRSKLSTVTKWVTMSYLRMTRRREC